VAAAEERALTVADLTAYRKALQDPAAVSEPPAVVGFRTLWEHPATYEGRRVQVEGSLVRRFRQGPFGTFPPLEEAWVTTPKGDPFCLVFPAASKAATGQAGLFRFTGTFLKLVEYQGGDGQRLAPLIVGPAPPVAVIAAPGRPSARVDAGKGRATALDWTIGLAAAVVVSAVLAYQHLRKPPGQPLQLKSPLGPEPVFDDGEDLTLSGSDSCPS
jgi:hypothetical protein